jgi:hypothetical protein
MEKAAPAPDAAHCNDNNCTIDNAPKTGNKGALKSIFKRCATCAGSGAGGLLAGHAGCVITPLVIAAAGMTTATAGMSILAVAFGAAATAGGLYLWHRLRGKQAGKWEKRIVVGSALAGLAFSSAFNLASHHQHHHGMHMQNPAPFTEVYCGSPPPARQVPDSAAVKPPVLPAHH